MERGRDLPPTHDRIDPVRRVAQQGPLAADRQIPRDIPLEQLRAVDTQEAFAQTQISLITDKQRAVAERFGKSVGELAGHPVSQPLRDMSLEGIIGGIPVVIDHEHATELRVHHNEVLRQPGMREKPAIDPRADGRRVKEVGQSAYRTVRDHGVCHRVFSERLRAGQRVAVHGDGTQKRKCDSHQHLVKQRGVAAGPGNIEGIQYAVFEDVGVVQLLIRVEFTPLVADVIEVDRQRRSQLPLDRKIEALDIGSSQIVRIAIDGGHAVRQRHRGERLRTAGRYRHHTRGADAGQIEEARRVVLCIQRLAREVANAGVHREKVHVADVVDPVAGTDHRGPLEPGQLPSNAHGRTEGLPVIVVHSEARVGRIWADELGCR